MTNFKPLRENIIVERFEIAKVTASGIILPGASLDTTTARGKVLAVGEGVVNEKTGEVTPLDVSVGDTIIFLITSGIKLSEKNETPEIFIMREEDILAIESE